MPRGIYERSKIAGTYRNQFTKNKDIEPVKKDSDDSPNLQEMGDDQGCIIL